MMMASLCEVGWVFFVRKGGIANLESKELWRLIRRLRNVAEFAK